MTFMPETPTLRDRIAAGILDTAAAVLAGRGESARMAEIADAGGVSRATLYRYFPTRDALLNALAEAASAELRERIADAELDTIPVPEAIGRAHPGLRPHGQQVRRTRPLRTQTARRGQPSRTSRSRYTGCCAAAYRRHPPLRCAPEVLVQIFGSLLETAIRISTYPAPGPRKPARRSSASSSTAAGHGPASHPGPASSSPADAQ